MYVVIGQHSPYLHLPLADLKCVWVEVLYSWTRSNHDCYGTGGQDGTGLATWQQLWDGKKWIEIGHNFPPGRLCMLCFSLLTPQKDWQLLVTLELFGGFQIPALVKCISNVNLTSSFTVYNFFSVVRLRYFSLLLLWLWVVSSADDEKAHSFILERSVFANLTLRLWTWALLGYPLSSPSWCVMAVGKWVEITWLPPPTGVRWGYPLVTRTHTHLPSPRDNPGADRGA